MRELKKIILHHTASSQHNTSISQIKRWHEQRGLGSGCQYHYVIFSNGDVKQTRSPAKVGNHCWGNNKDSLGVALIGNFEQDILTEAQWVSLVLTLKKLLKRHNLKPWNIFTHNELGQTSGHTTACPGKNVIKELGRLHKELTKEENVPKPATNVAITQSGRMEKIWLFLKNLLKQLKLWPIFTNKI